MGVTLYCFGMPAFLRDLRPLLGFGADERGVFVGAEAAELVALARRTGRAPPGSSALSRCTSWMRATIAFGVAAGASTPFQL